MVTFSHYVTSFPQETNISSQGRAHGGGQGLIAGPLLRSRGNEETQLSDPRHGQTHIHTHKQTTVTSTYKLILIHTDPYIYMQSCLHVDSYCRPKYLSAALIQYKYTQFVAVIVLSDI